MVLADALDWLVMEAESQGSGIRSGLRPGLGRAEIATSVAAYGLTLPDEVSAVFEWRDGYQIPVDPPYFNEFGVDVGPIGLEQALEIYERMDLAARDAFDDLIGSSGGWFPVFATGWGVAVVAVWSQGQIQAVVHWTEDWTFPATLPSTILAAVKWWMGLIETGQWRFNRSTGWTDLREVLTPLVVAEDNPPTTKA